MERRRHAIMKMKYFCWMLCRFVYVMVIFRVSLIWRLNQIYSLREAATKYLLIAWFNQ
jgi:hypothetical protein